MIWEIHLLPIATQTMAIHELEYTNWRKTATMIHQLQ